MTFFQHLLDAPEVGSCVFLGDQLGVVGDHQSWSISLRTYPINFKEGWQLLTAIQY